MKQLGYMATAISGLVLVAGCSPLAQAPLVYASKQTVGLDVDVAGTGQQTPGINVGFKNIDVAYIPVAVSTKQCNNEGEKIKTTVANYDTVGNVTSIETKLGNCIEEIKSKDNEQAATKKDDTLSVFGTFQGQADTSVEGKVKGNLGKVFSTGQAARNLTGATQMEAETAKTKAETEKTNAEAEKIKASSRAACYAKVDYDAAKMENCNKGIN